MQQSAIKLCAAFLLECANTVENYSTTFDIVTSEIDSIESTAATLKALTRETLTDKQVIDIVSTHDIAEYIIAVLDCESNDMYPVAKIFDEYI